MKMKTQHLKTCVIQQQQREGFSSKYLHQKHRNVSNKQLNDASQGLRTARIKQTQISRRKKKNRAEIETKN
jgi:hypothetical protein